MLLKFNPSINNRLNQMISNINLGLCSFNSKNGNAVKALYKTIQFTG
ncbi:MAG: hypothetical protein JWQ25_2832 [Daejeonella sp.]|nr:hypothetical protein [Daejeonella sp.]